MDADQRPSVVISLIRGNALSALIRGNPRLKSASLEGESRTQLDRSRAATLAGDHAERRRVVESQRWGAEVHVIEHIEEVHRELPPDLAADCRVLADPEIHIPETRASERSGPTALGVPTQLNSAIRLIRGFRVGKNVQPGT